MGLPIIKNMKNFYLIFNHFKKYILFISLDFIAFLLLFILQKNN